MSSVGVSPANGNEVDSESLCSPVDSDEDTTFDRHEATVSSDFHGIEILDRNSDFDGDGPINPMEHCVLTVSPKVGKCGSSFYVEDLDNNGASDLSEDLDSDGSSNTEE